MTHKILPFILFYVLIICGCTSIHPKKNDAKEQLTVGKIQQEIRVGMTNTQVVEILGSPNIVTTDEQRREVWIYDKISTELDYSTNANYGSLIILSGQHSVGSQSTSQRTLTIIIKFNTNNNVRDFAYRQSSF